MRPLERRVRELEHVAGNGGPTCWHRIIVDGQSEEQARADYEAMHGPIGHNEGVVYRTMVAAG